MRNYLTILFLLVATSLFGQGRLNDPSVLKGYWKLAGDAKDYSGNGNHFIWNGVEGYANGPFGKDVCVLTSIRNLYCDITYPTNTSTVSLWYKDNGTVNRYLFDARYPSSKLGYIQLASGGITVPSGTIYVDKKVVASGTFIPKSNTWHHVVVSGMTVFAERFNLAMYNGSSSIDGNMFNFRVYNTTLTSSEVSALYQLDQQPSLPPISPEQPYDVLPDRNDPSLIGAWLNRATYGSANDYSTNARNGTATSVRWEKVGGVFNKTTSMINTGSDCIGTNICTLSFLAKVASDGEGSVGSFISNGRYACFLSGGGTIYFYPAGVTSCTSASGAVSYNKWNHVLITRNVNSGNSNVVNIYVNGILSGAADQTVLTPVVGLNNIIIGNTLSGANTTDGTIKDLRIYNRILSTSEITSLYLQSVPDPDLLCHIQNGKDISRYQRTITNYKVSTGSGPMRFNGVDSYLSTPAFVSTNNYTMTAWFRADSLGASSAGRFFFHGTAQPSLWLGSATTFYYGQSSTISAGNVGYLFPQWNHVAVTRTGNLINFYFNGIQVGPANQNAGVTTEPTTLYIGNVGTLDRTFKGMLSEVKFYRGSKSADWIAQDYVNSVGFYK